jgi:hypothetical protein
VRHNGVRYIVCLNDRQARKDELDRQAIIESLKQQLEKGPKALVGNIKIPKIPESSDSLNLIFIDKKFRSIFYPRVRKVSLRPPKR